MAGTDNADALLCLRRCAQWTEGYAEDQRDAAETILRRRESTRFVSIVCIEASMQLRQCDGGVYAPKPLVVWNHLSVIVGTRACCATRPGRFITGCQTACIRNKAAQLQSTSSCLWTCGCIHPAKGEVAAEARRLCVAGDKCWETNVTRGTQHQVLEDPRVSDRAIVRQHSPLHGPRCQTQESQ